MQINTILHAIEQGKEVIRRTTPKPKTVFPDLSAFRSKQSEPLTTLAELRRQEPY